MSGLMTDVLTGAQTPDKTNAACNAAGKLLKMVELEYKFGLQPGNRRAISVAGEEVQDAPGR